MKKFISMLCTFCGLLLFASAQEKGLMITGTITSSENAESLPGAGILEKGKSNATRSDSIGNYRIRVTDPNGTLIISYVGYKTKEVKISGQSEIDIVLDPATASMQEVVVVGYGT